MEQIKSQLDTTFPMKKSFHKAFQNCDIKDMNEIRAVEYAAGFQLDLNVFVHLSKLPKLEQLAIDDLRTEYPEELAELVNLRLFSITDSRHTEFPDAVYNMPYLEVLRYRYGDLGYLNPRITQLHALKVLDLESNHLWWLPDDLDKLIHMEVLVLRDNEFREIPDVVFELSNLIVLNLDYNHLTEIPPDIARLSKLQSLRSTHNQICKTPSQLQTLRALDILSIGHNRLTTYPLAYNAKYLELNDNLIEYPLPTPQKYDRLIHLDVSNNPTKYPFFLQSPPALETLNVSGTDVGNNKMAIVTKPSLDLKFTGVFDTPVAVKQLYLSNCNIKNITRDCFKKLPLVEFIDLNDNKIEHLNFTDVALCSKLKELTLKNNLIDTITGKLKELPHLSVLDLQNNQITQLDQDLFEDATQLTQLSLADNETLQMDFWNHTHLPNLEYLNLSGCNINVFPSLNKLPLKFLGLGGAKFSELDPGFPYAQLETLLLEGTHLKTLPEEVLQIKHFAFPTTVEEYPSKEVQHHHSGYKYFQENPPSAPEPIPGHPPQNERNMILYKSRSSTFSEHQTLRPKTNA